MILNFVFFSSTEVVRDKDCNEDAGDDAIDDSVGADDCERSAACSAVCSGNELSLEF